MGLFARLVVIVLGIMSLASTVITIERVIVFWKSMNNSVTFTARVAAQFAKGELEEAAASAKISNDAGHIGRVLASGLQAFRTAPQEDKDLTFESVARALERQSLREVQSFKRGQGIVATVASTAPFVGLLGTVMGIVNAFQLMAASGSGGLGTVSAGIAEALVTTAFGLLVAIPAVMEFNYLNGWVDARAVDMAEASNELLDVVARHVKGAPQAEAAE
jgi:biopolymer transport protein ExbB/biopolymer transport protein TolQ